MKLKPTVEKSGFFDIAIPRKIIYAKYIWITYFKISICLNIFFYVHSKFGLIDYLRKLFLPEFLAMVVLWFWKWELIYWLSWRWWRCLVHLSNTGTTCSWKVYLGHDYTGVLSIMVMKVKQNFWSLLLGFLTSPRQMGSRKSRSEFEVDIRLKGTPFKVHFFELGPNSKRF